MCEECLNAEFDYAVAQIKFHYVAARIKDRIMVQKIYQATVRPYEKRFKKTKEKYKQETELERLKGFSKLIHKLERLDRDKIYKEAEAELSLLNKD
jgi:hypothetical protein